MNLAIHHLYSISETIGHIGNPSRQTIYDEINSGRLRSVKRGRRRFCTGKQIIQYIEMLEREAEEQAAVNA